MSVSLSASAFDHPAGIPDTLGEFLRSRVEQNPGGKFVEIRHDGSRVSSTVEELHRRALNILARLREHVAAGPSDVVLCFEGALDFVPAAWACIWGGYSCLPWHMPARGNDQGTLSTLQLIGRRLEHPVLLTTEDIKDRFLRRETSPFEAAISIDHVLDLHANAASRRGAPARPPANAASDAAFLVPTSGTTATPKIAVITHRCSLNRFLATGQHRWKRSRVYCFPFGGVTGMWLAYPGLADNIFLQPDRLAAQPLEILRVVEEFRLESISVSSSIASRILEAAEDNGPQDDLSSLRHVGFGAEMIVPDIVRRLGLQFGRWGASDLSMSFGYGMTETGLICCTEQLDPDQAVGHLEAGGGPVSVGACVSGWSLRIVDDEGLPLPSGAAGNIEVWSETQLCSGYRGDPAANEESFASDGWFKTGDIGIADLGTLTITGRQKATIIINARSVSLESIEAPVRDMDGILRSLVAAAPLRPHHTATDELAVFFVPRDHDPRAVDDLCRSIRRETARRSGVAVKHLVPVTEAEFPLTATGKVRRHELVRLCEAGTLTPRLPAIPGRGDAGSPLTPTDFWLMDVWKKVLKLEFLPSPEDDFFELGGDSLASAELIAAVEEKSGCQLPVDAFFQRPTIATLHGLLALHGGATRPGSAERAPDGGYRLLHRLQGYTGSWRGERLCADSLVVGLNGAGSRTPIFWVFQDQSEFVQLARHLGPDQPLYGMRSCVGIVAVKDYSTGVIETVCNRYLWEILALPIRAPFIVGGNCQGGILALALARRLKQIGRAPSPLVLMEWTYSYGPYTDPTVLLYGDQSHTAEIYVQPETRTPNWRDDFPRHTVAPIPGGHGHFFDDGNVGGLAEVLRSCSGNGPAAPRQSDWSHREA